MSSIKITYIRFDGTLIPMTNNKDFYLKIFHIDMSTFPSRVNAISIGTLSGYVANPSVIKQKFVTNDMPNEDVAEWDNLSVILSGITSTSGLIVFALQKSSNYLFINFNDQVIDFYFLPDLLTTVENSNQHTVYNTDNISLLRMTTAITMVTNPSTTIPSIIDVPIEPIRDQYYSTYVGILNELINNTVNSEIPTSGLTPQQIYIKSQLLRSTLIVNKQKMNSFEKQAEEILNSQYREQYYSNYVSLQNNVSQNQTVKSNTASILSTLKNLMYFKSALVPFSERPRTSNNLSNIRLSVHYSKL